MRRLGDAVRRLWGEISAPPHQKPIYFTAYVVTTLTGTATLVSPPTSIEGEIGPVLASLWAWLLISGGVLGALTVFSRLWWLERIALSLAALGLIVYATVVLTLHFQSATGSRLTQEGVIILAAFLYLARWFTIRHYTFEPRPHSAGE